MTEQRPPILDGADPGAVEAFLRERDWLPDGARVTAVARAGEGNMNLVLRVHWRTGAAAQGADADADAGTLILKQARPWVEKYPDIAAPPGRLAVEADFYRRTAMEPALAARMPALLHVDEAACAACLEDLGSAADHLSLYADATLSAADLDTLLAWLSRLHRLEVSADAWPRLRNADMRALNHAHIFQIPFAADAPDADGFCPGLGAVAATLRGDARLLARLQALGEHYLADGERLLHGDFYPGSWLACADGPRIIDPEFAFLGAAEFDLGVLRAHLLFAGNEDPDLSAYVPPPGHDAALARAFAGAEVLRRLLGVAQLPLQADLPRRCAWIETARHWLRD
ncbi:MAG TPA: hypothetical protein VLA56_02580 [Pseudomonadales bacterium]|nr:hypothetical protein [Pseudomonadales bacterium]